MRKKFTLYELLMRNEVHQKELDKQLENWSKQYLPERYWFTFCPGDGIMITRDDDNNIFCTKENLEKLLKATPDDDFDQVFDHLI